jgi:hypothetical protein
MGERLRDTSGVLDRGLRILRLYAMGSGSLLDVAGVYVAFCYKLIVEAGECTFTGFVE